MNFKEKKNPVTTLIFKSGINFTDEDKVQIKRLIETYFRKRSNYVNSKIENLAGALLWVYSRINFLFEHDKMWSQQEIARILGIKKKTISNIAGKIMDSLNIDMFDPRFAKKEIVDLDPRNNFFMTKSGFIMQKEDLKNIILNSKLKKIQDSNYLKDKKKIIKDKKEYKNQENKNKKLSEFFK